MEQEVPVRPRYVTPPFQFSLEFAYGVVVTRLLVEQESRVRFPLGNPTRRWRNWQPRQLERLVGNSRGGSIPPLRTKFSGSMPKKPRHLPVEQAQAGASPVDPAMFCPGGVIGSRARFRISWVTPVRVRFPPRAPACFWLYYLWRSQLGYLCII